MMHNNFKSALEDIDEDFEKNASIVHTSRWQSIDIKNKPEARMVEQLHVSFGVDLSKMGLYDLDTLRREIEPNLPWADNHFKERICGHPINPGLEWENWPWASFADKHRKAETFNHNYMERYWPKKAGVLNNPTKTSEQFMHLLEVLESITPVVNNEGIREEFGDLNDLINLLAKEPSTRQAYLPIWFPEDTGDVHMGRKPCTLGYHFIMRNGKLDVTYYIRSCDYLRHFRDDIYLTLLLQKHVLERCKVLNYSEWAPVTPGKFIMHITSLHLFINDYLTLYKRMP